MTAFSFGEFRYLIDGTSTCVLGANQSEQGNAAVSGISFSGIARIPAHVIYNDTEYTIHRVGRYAFRGCSGMTGVVLPKTITYLGYDGFYGTSITSFFIPFSVQRISGSGFSHLLLTTRVIIEAGSKLEHLESAAFASMPKLESIILPSSIQIIGNQLFANNYALRFIVYCGANDFSHLENTFLNINHPVTVYVTSSYPSNTFDDVPVTRMNESCQLNFPIVSDNLHSCNSIFMIPTPMILMPVFLSLSFCII